MPDIFISYSTKNKVRIERLARALENEGFDVWWDKHLEPGQKFRPMIQRQLNVAKVVLVAWTKHSVKSNWVLQESTHALERGALLPIFLESVALPMPFGEIQSADLSHWKGEQDDPAFRSLIKTFHREINSQAPENKTEEKAATYTVNADTNPNLVGDEEKGKTPKQAGKQSFFKMHWKATLLGLGAIIMTIFGIAGGVLDVTQLYTEFLGTPTISIEHSPNRDLKPNEPFSLTYQAPAKGHLSLWQLKPDGAAERQLPLAITEHLSVPSTRQTEPMRFSVYATGTSRFVLLWTPEGNPQHLNYPKYDNVDSFDAALKVLKDHAQATKAETSVTIIPKP